MPESTIAAVLKRVLIASMRLVIRAAAVGRARNAEALPRVCYLVAHGWGTGGTIRTTFTVAEALAVDHDIEIVSVIRRPNRPGFPAPAAVRMRALDDQHSQRRRSRAERWLRARPSRLVTRRDGLAKHCSLWTDLQIVRMLATTRADIIVATRPSLIAIVATLRPPGVALVGQEHLNLETRRAAGRAPSLAACRRMDALVTLTEDDRAAYAEALPGMRVVAIPNPVPSLSSVND